MPLQIVMRERKPCFFELSLTGRLDTATAPQLEQKLATLRGAPVRGLVLDLARLEYISSMGLRVIFKARQDLASGVFMVSNMQPPVQRVFEIAQIVPEEQYFASLEEADRYYDEIQRKVKSGE
ncbi:MAG: STAS domain-containing protein [Elusimicrobia bacterium]|nr:STAS domain-containing protein [Elusimicrobiota bacterium]